MKNSSKGIIKKSSNLLFGQLSISLFSFLTIMITSRALEPEGRGYLALTLLIANCLYVFTEFGLGKSVVRILSSRKLNREIVISNYLYFILIKILFFAIISFYVFFNTKFSTFIELPLNLVWISVLQFIPIAITGSLLFVLLGLNLYNSYTKVLIFSSLTSFAILTLLYFFSVLTLFKVLLVMFLINVLNVFIIIKMLLTKINFLYKFNFFYIKFLFSDAIKFYLINIVSFSQNRFGFFIINIFLGPYSLGIYTLSYTLCERISIIPDSISTILFPEISKNPKIKNSQTTSIIFRFTMILIIIISIIIFFLSEWLVILLFGESFKDSILILKYLLGATIFTSGWKIISQYFNAVGFSSLSLRIESIGLLIFIIMSFILIPEYKLEGACFAVILSSLTNLFLGLIKYNKINSRKNSLYKFSIKEKSFIKKKLNL